MGVSIVIGWGAPLRVVLRWIPIRVHHKNSDKGPKPKPRDA